jgi:hemolysin III
LVLDGGMARAILIAIWSGAALGIALKLLWPDTPKWLTAVLYVALGWVAVAAFPQLAGELGVAGMALIAGGGVLYTAGAVVYALRRPDPAPAVFGYHEIFHVLVIAAAVLQYVAVAAYALPAG